MQAADTIYSASHLLQNGIDRNYSSAQTFPGRFDIGPDPTAGKEGVMLLDVLATLFAAFQRPLTDTEWAPLETIDVQVLSKHAIVA